MKAEETFSKKKPNLQHFWEKLIDESGQRDSLKEWYKAYIG